MTTLNVRRVTGDLQADVAALLGPLAAGTELGGRSVLLKPNLVEPLPHTSGQTTNPALIEALVVWCRAMGAVEIAIGEGPSYFQPRSDLRRCFARTGMIEVARRQGIRWILFDDEPFRRFRNHSPRTPDRFGLSEHAFTWDRIINVPVPKPHYLTTLSCAMKNLKGFIRREDKPSFHYGGTEGIYGSVTELNCMIRPALNVVDCTAPTHVNQGFLLAGTDIVAIDALMASWMGLNPDRIETVQLGHRAGLGEKDLSRIRIVGDDLRGISMNFEQPAAWLARAFPGLSLQARQACSGCLIPLMGALRDLEAAGWGCGRPLTVALGTPVPGDRQPDAAIGKCARREGAAFLPGCPPTRAEVYAFVSEQLLRA